MGVGDDSYDALFTRAEKLALKKHMRTAAKEYVESYLDAEAERQARIIVKKLKTEIRILVEKEFQRRLPKSVRLAVGKIHSSISVWTTSKRALLRKKL